MENTWIDARTNGFHLYRKTGNRMVDVQHLNDHHLVRLLNANTNEVLEQTKVKGGTPQDAARAMKIATKLFEQQKKPLLEQ